MNMCEGTDKVLNNVDSRGFLLKGWFDQKNVSIIKNYGPCSYDELSTDDRLSDRTF